MNRTLCIYISQDQYDYLKSLADKYNRSVSYLIQRLIDHVRDMEDEEREDDVYG